MNIIGVMFAAVAVLAIVAFLRKRRRDLEELRQMETDEEIHKELGYTQLDDFEVSQDPEAWRGDEHHDDDDDEDMHVR